MPAELQEKLQGAESAQQQAGEASARADADDLGGKILTLEPKEALRHFKQLDIERLKSVLAHYKVPVEAASTKKHVQQLLLDNLPTGQKRLLQAGREQLEAEAQETEAASTARRQEAAEKKAQKNAATHAKLVRTL